MAPARHQHSAQCSPETCSACARIRTSTWSLHKDEVFAELLARLHQMQIEPIGALGQLAAVVEHRTWRPRDREHEIDEVDAVIEDAITQSEQSARA